MKTEPHRAALQSATLSTAEYDFNLAQLVLDFQDGSRYLYSGVQAPVFVDLLRASSQGTFFNQEIRNRYSYVRIW
jgi:lysyl-tRNA synthetase class 2